MIRYHTQRCSDVSITDSVVSTCGQIPPQLVAEIDVRPLILSSCAGPFWEEHQVDRHIERVHDRHVEEVDEMQIGQVEDLL